MAVAMMRLNFAQPDPGPGELHARYRAGIDMAVWAESHGIATVTHEEHHGVENGWSPSPLVTAAAILSGTTTLEVSVRALLVPLHDPLRIAEDIAVIDIMSAGRLTVVGGIGHRAAEYEAHGKDWAARGALMDHCVATLLEAWTGEPFEHLGTIVRVTPKPYSTPVPFLLGGNSRPAARRAARFGLPIFFSAWMPELATYYLEQCEAMGWAGEVIMPPVGFCHHFVVDDPDRAWAEFGGHLLHEATVYAGFTSPEHTSAVHTTATTVEDLRARGTYRFMTPDEALAEANAAGPGYSFNFHPLCGGLPIDAAWEMLQRWSDDVVPRLAAT